MSVLIPPDERSLFYLLDSDNLVEHVRPSGIVSETSISTVRGTSHRGSCKYDKISQYYQQEAFPTWFLLGKARPTNISLSFSWSEDRRLTIDIVRKILDGAPYAVDDLFPLAGYPDTREVLRLGVGLSVLDLRFCKRAYRAHR